MYQETSFFKFKIVCGLLFSLFIGHKNYAQNKEQVAAYISLSFNKSVNKNQEEYNQFSVGFFKKGITSHINPDIYSIVYSKARRFNPRINKSAFEFYIKRTGGFSFSKIHKQHMFYFNFGVIAGLKKIQKVFTSKVLNPLYIDQYDITYQNKILIGMPLGIQYMLTFKKKNAFGVHTEILLKKNAELTFGLDYYFGHIRN